MTRRLLRLIQQKRVKPEQVLAVTFTRTAANDLRRTLEKVLGEEYRSFWATTLHSLCFRVVETENFLEVRNRHPRFLLAASKSSNLGFEAAPMLADLKEENDNFGTPTEQSRRIRDYESMWARRQQDALGVTTAGVDATYQGALLSWLRFHRGMFVGELVAEAYQFLAAEPDSPWRSRFKAILVDEYQDLNKLDQTVVDLFSSDNGAMCSVVGDFDQSIYSFRNAHMDGLQEYSQKTGVDSRSMEVSRRCPTSHLGPAQSHIQQNQRRAVAYPTALETAATGEISVRRFRDRASEVKGVVTYVQYCLDQGIAPGEILIMVPSRLIGQDIRRALGASNVEAQSYFAEEQLEEVEAQRAFTILTLLRNKYDRVSLRCWLGGWSSSQRPASYKKLREYCEVHNSEPWDTMEQVLDGKVDIQGIGVFTEPFAEIKRLVATLKEVTGQQLLEALFPAGEEWADDIRTLVEISVSEGTSASELYDALIQEITQPTMPDEVDHVRVMSLHKSKGLTAKASIIAGAIEGLLPRPHNPKKSSITEHEHLEEQRRLFYVAMTRSTDRLLISSAQYVDSQFARTYQLPGIQSGHQWKTVSSSFVTVLAQSLPPVSSSLLYP